MLKGIKNRVHFDIKNVCSPQNNELKTEIFMFDLLPFENWITDYNFLFKRRDSKIQNHDLEIEPRDRRESYHLHISFHDYNELILNCEEKSQVEKYLFPFYCSTIDLIQNNSGIKTQFNPFLYLTKYSNDEKSKILTKEIRLKLLKEKEKITRIFNFKKFDFESNIGIDFSNENWIKNELFLKKITEDIDKDKLVLIKNVIKESQKGAKKSLYLFKNYIIDSTSIFTTQISSILEKTIEQLENRFFIRFIKIMSFVTKKYCHHLSFLVYEENTNNLVTFQKAFKAYFTWFFTENYFHKNKLMTKENIKQSDLNSILKILIEQFNCFTEEFFQNINLIFTNNFEDYFKIQPELLKSRDKLFLSQKMKFWVKDIFENRTHFILLMLFPELKLFIGFKDNFKVAKTPYKDLHFLVSFIITKFHFILPFLRAEFKLCQISKEFNIFNSQRFKYFILEVRLILALISPGFKLDHIKRKFLYFKSFISFIRLQNEDLLSYFLVDDFLEFENFILIHEFVKFDSNWVYNTDDHNLKKDKLFQRGKIIGFDLESINHNNIILQSDKSYLKPDETPKENENNLEVYILNQKLLTNRLSKYFTIILSD